MSINTTTTTPAATPAATFESQKMDQDIFTQLYQSLAPITGATASAQDTSVFDEWLKQDFLSPEYSVNSSPEIATPLDQFLMSPFQSKGEVSAASCSFMNSVDLEVSAVLDSPVSQLFHHSPLSTSTITAAPSPIATPAQMANLFADIGDSLPAALAALAAVAAPSPALVASPTKTESLSPAVASASIPAFSAAIRTTKKRAAEEDDPSDDAAAKRQKNTDAARRSRLRKVQKMETLETRVSDLEKINAGLLMRVAVLDSEKTNLKAKESSYENRIKVLEDQLAEAHKVLSSRS